MKIQIKQAIKQGLEVIIKNPAIAAVVIVYGILACIYFYFLFYAPKLAAVPEQALFPENFWLYTILSTLVSLFLACVICKMVYDAVKSRVSLSEAVSVSARKFILVLIASIVFALIAGVGLFALIIPGIFLGVKFIFITYAILLDDEGVANSFKKSWQITGGNWWKIFGLYLILGAPMMILFSIASGIAVASVQTALVIDFIAMLIGGWLIAAFTIAYIQLTSEQQKEREEITTNAGL